MEPAGRGRRGAGAGPAAHRLLGDRARGRRSLGRRLRPRGRMLAQAVTGTPGHVNSMAEAVKHFLARLPARRRCSPATSTSPTTPGWAPGHLNDFVLTTPCLPPRPARRAVLLHQPPHGHRRHRLRPGRHGRVHGGHLHPAPQARRRGRLNETLLAMIRANTRLPVDTEGDVYSLAACNDVGCRRLVEMMDEFGLEDLDRLAEHIFVRSRDGGARRDRRAAEGHLAQRDDGRRLRGAGDARRDNDDRRSGIHVDYAGTAPASRRGINVPLAYTTAYTVFGLACVVAPRHPEQRRLAPAAHRLGAAEGCILNAPKPAPVASRHVIGQMLPDVVFGCLRQAIPDRVPAEGTSCLWNLNVRGQAVEDGGNYGFTMAVTSNGGTGARPAEGRALGDRLSFRREGHAGRDRRIDHAADLLAEGAAPGFRRRRSHPRRPRPDHRDREPDRAPLRSLGGLRSHRPSAPRPRRRPQWRRGLCGPEVRASNSRARASRKSRRASASS